MLTPRAAIYSQPSCADSVSATPKVARTVNQTVVAVNANNGGRIKREK